MPWLSILWKVITSRVGLCAIVAIIAYTYGYRKADRAHDIATLTATVERLRSDAKASEDILREAAKRADDAAKLAASYREQAEAYAAELAQEPPAAPGCNCGFGKRDIDRLRNLARPPTRDPSRAP